MTDRISIIPPSMQNIVDRAGYVPAVQAAGFVFCAGQVGRDSNLSVITDPEQQFHACWDNVDLVLAAAGCTFDDVVEMTTFHVDLAQNIDLFRKVKDLRFPRGRCAWTCIGVSDLAVDGLLVEIKCIAMNPVSG
ncbi:RidA family protein [Sphingomonadaceae bacterium OTU29LAMAA1]|nr:RidA family protein [Sphingomonadaceae bacterium OTU29LAMAA1]